MINDQKETIKTLRSQGQPISQIAAKLGISINTVKAFLRREQKKKEFCRYCHKPLIQLSGRKPKTFCNDSCRYAWWKGNRNQLKHQILYHFTCAYCCKAFDSISKSRKYCSHQCYITSRFGVP